METQKLWIPHRLPGLNEMLKMRGYSRRTRGRKGRMIRISKYDDWKLRVESMIRLHIREQGIEPVAAANFKMTFVEQDRRRDKDNIMVGQKFIFDALVQGNILTNDGWNQVRRIKEPEFVVDKDGPGVWVEIEEVAV